jgi:nucleoside-diphosphate-sugar epimerase
MKYFLTGAFQMAEKIIGIRAPRIRLSPGIMKATAALSGFFGSFLPIPELYSEEILRASAGVTYTGDNSKARKELGYAPRPLEEGLRVTLEAMRTEFWE